MKTRLDQMLLAKGMAPTRSQAENYIRLGKVTVNGHVVTKPGFQAREGDDVRLAAGEQYVSRAALKLESVAQSLKLNFDDKVMLDVGSSTGGFTDFALRHGAKKVIAVDVGTDQLHPSLRTNERVELHEKTDIRDVNTLSEPAHIVLIDVSFISLRDILPTVAKLAPAAQIVAMVKPQFEADNDSFKHKGVIKNDAMRRTILKSFESWVQNIFAIIDKADSEVSGAKGNKERFYLLKKLV